ncbi:hypothetical protein RRF57_001105 [Xylaria bambusicola]|uniref:Uncharacterized protein n=1 Tax=Xylaria bambusicola TaxID=326684 RepID=A0AAN7UB00_9PEZI
MWGWWDGVTLDNQRIQIDHLLMVVQEVNDDLARNARGQRRDGRECRSLRHGSAVVLRSLFFDFATRDREGCIFAAQRRARSGTLAA